MSGPTSNSPVAPHRPLQGSLLRDYILGSQDGIVNILGLLLGVAAATASTKLVLIAGLAATFAESLSMAAVAYTSSKAARDHYLGELRKEREHIERVPEAEREEIRMIYRKKGFAGSELEDIVQRITSDKKIWLESMMAEELRLFPSEYRNPLRIGLLVGVSAVLGSLIPLVPFVVLPVSWGILTSLLVSMVTLFVIGTIKAKLTIGDWKKSGLEMAAIGTAAAVAGYLIGLALAALL